MFDLNNVSRNVVRKITSGLHVTYKLFELPQCVLAPCFAGQLVVCLIILQRQTMDSTDRTSSPPPAYSDPTSDPNYGYDANTQVTQGYQVST